MTINIVDASGTPRNTQELMEARDAIKKEMVSFTGFSPIYIHFTVILDSGCLE
jgi:hypothetical protein